MTCFNLNYTPTVAFQQQIYFYFYGGFFEIKIYFLNTKIKIIYAYHMNLYISETDMEPVLEFLRAKAMRQLYEYAGLGKPESLGCMPLPVTTFFLIMLLGVRGAPERW